MSMERRTKTKTIAGPLAATGVGTVAALLLSLWSGRADTAGLGWLPDHALHAQGVPGAAPVYTNDDLERVRPLRGETGVTSQPAFASATSGCTSHTRAGRGRSKRHGASETCAVSAADGAEPAARASAGRGETYWRREAERVREKQRLWRQQAEDLELKIAERRRKPDVRPYTDPQIVGWQRRADALRARMRELEGDLDDRARRERALPGWLR